MRSRRIMMDNASKLYQYEPLSSNSSSIRLLRLLKSKNGPICCRLVHCELPQSSESRVSPLRYEALSYTWGNNEQVERIRVNQKTLWVTSNLYSALQNLRLTDKDRLLWIDAVCIDQKDDVEKSHQVQRMGDIYSYATTVIVWLGLPSFDASVLMKRLQWLQSLLPNWDAEQKNWKEGEWKQITMRESWQQKLIDQCSKGLRLLLNRPWFERVWILQEVAKAREIIVCSGKYSIPAPIFVFAASLIKLPADHRSLPVLSLMTGPPNVSLDQQKDLDHFLMKFKTSKATDERDKIYALMGLASGPIVNAIPLDYQQSVMAVVDNCVNRLLKSTDITIYELLDILSSFVTLNCLCVIWPSESKVQRELLSCSTKQGKRIESEESDFGATEDIVVPRSSVSFHSERRKGTSIQTPGFHFDIVTSIARGGKKFGKNGRQALQPNSWGAIDQNVKLVVINQIDKALLEACFNGYEHIVKLLLNKDETKIDSLQSVRDSGGKTPLSWAAHNGHKSVVKLLLRTSLVAVNIEDQDGKTPLYYAASQGCEEVLKLLLETGKTNADTCDSIKRTPLYWASKHGNTTMVEQLLKIGAKVNLKAEDGHTPLFWAVTSGNEPLAKLLLTVGKADAKAKTKSGKSPLHWAAQHDKAAMAKILLELGEASVNTREKHDNGTPLHLAAIYGSKTVAKVLLEDKADFNAEDKRKRTPLHLAAEHGKTEVITILVEAGVKVNAKDKFGWTPLFLAVDKRQKQAIKLLLKTREVELDVEDKNRYTPMSWAAARKHEDIVRLLEEGNNSIDRE